MARKKLSTGKLQFTGVFEEDGSLITVRDRIVDRAQELYEKLYSASKKGKAPRPDNITIERIDSFLTNA